MNKMKKGVFCLSIDLELLWGRRAGDYASFKSSVLKERRIIDQILNMCKKNKIHVTWATVGHVFLDSCEVKNDIRHPEIIRNTQLHGMSDWFSVDPGSSSIRNPEWYGADILAKILDTPFQEIGSHSFSHINFDKKYTSTLSAASEIKACVAIAKKMKLQLISFVYPYNCIDHLEILKKYGFLCFRGKERHWYSAFPSFLEKSFQLLDLFLPIAPSICNPEYDRGLLNIQGSYYFLSHRGFRKFIPRGVRFGKAKIGIEKAIEKKEVFHMWFHPIDIISKENALLKELEQILEYVGDKVKKGTLSSKTMGEIANDHY
jgi:peptidoglycan/xylan/chitin deacetylase (PgdA/CDA1 family)